MKQGQTYSMQFPYCTGCWDESYSRDFWDYWTGKFLIFESTDGGSEGHTIKGASFVGSTFIGQDGKPFAYDDAQSFLQEYDGYELGGEQALLLGNQTFAKMGSTRENLWTYYAYSNDEGFWPSFEEGDISEIEPTGSFLIAEVVVPELAEGVKSISRGGNITYKYGNNGDPNNGTTTGSHTPTVGGDNDMFITAIDGGINIAVAAPQNICVVNATGHIIFNGYVTTNTNVLLPMNGIYVVKGQNEVQKIFF